jgi:hypothetical protein
MKTKWTTFAAAALLSLVVAAPTSILAQATSSGQASGQTPAKKQGGERHPVIHKSINQLERVKGELQQEASRDFGGHRAKAVGHINQALQELQQALQADKQ